LTESTPMSLEAAFLRDIRESAEDDTPRLVYADWLEEHGDADRAEFIRGFVGKMTMTGEKFLQSAEGIFAACPLQQLRVLQPQNCFEQLLGCEALGRIRALDLGHMRLGMNRVMALAGSANVAGLTELDLTSAAMRPRGLAALAASPHLGKLRTLRLHNNDL